MPGDYCISNDAATHDINTHGQPQFESYFVPYVASLVESDSSSYTESHEKTDGEANADSYKESNAESDGRSNRRTNTRADIRSHDEADTESLDESHHRSIGSSHGLAERLAHAQHRADRRAFDESHRLVLSVDLDLPDAFANPQSLSHHGGVFLRPSQTERSAFRAVEQAGTQHAIGGERPIALHEGNLGRHGVQPHRKSALVGPQRRAEGCRLGTRL
mmetsp:Transcript_19264/g.34710  ORF Transcript_19264/g.34710 Transcript_19264/m.34710 type:complete len:218 (+) Transcript_19264:276-929(+)